MDSLVWTAGLIRWAVEYWMYIDRWNILRNSCREICHNTPVNWAYGYRIARPWMVSE